MSITLVQGDTAPTLRGTITDDATGNPLDLTNCSVFFQMRKKDDKKYTINGTCTITTAVEGLVSYALGANDLNTPGEYEAQFEVHYQDQRVQTTVSPIAVMVRRQ